MSVKAMTSSLRSEYQRSGSLSSYSCAIKYRARTRKWLDINECEDIIRLTGQADALPLIPRLQTQGKDTSSPRDTQSASGCCLLPAVSQQRLLRSRRSDAGEVRNAPSGPRRQSLRQRVRRQLRPLAPVVLSNASCLSGSWTLRLAPSQARPAGRPQADWAGYGVCPATEGRRSVYHGAATSRYGPRPVSGAGAPSQYSTSIITPKKKLVTSSFPHDNAAALRSAYEDLRAQAIAGGRAPGLALLLHHGMCEWMEVCPSSAMAVAVEPLAATAPPQMLPPEMRSEIVVILAGLFLNKQWEATR